MLVRVVPSYPGSDILFNCAMPDPMHDDNKPCPGSWRMQLDTLEALQVEGFALEYPRDIHALDKAAWPTALINEVIFDVVRRVICCIFVDGYSISWPMSSAGNDTRCLASLEVVISTVRQIPPATEQSRRQWVSDSPLSPTPEEGSLNTPQAETASVSTSSHRSKHRRQRSFLGSIVSAFKGILPDNMGRNSGPLLPSSLPPLKIPMSSHTRTSSTFSRTQVSPPGSPVVAEAPPVFRLVVRPREPLPPPEHGVPLEPHQVLRRYARSILLDAVRQHVYPMFSITGPPSFTDRVSSLEWAAQVTGFPPGLYPAWAARSMLRQTEDRLREMIADANSKGLGDTLPCGAVAPAPPSQQSSRDSDDSDDTTSATTSASASSLTTETDGSSVHTPLDSPVCSPFVPAAASSFPQLPLVEHKSPASVPHTPSPPPYDFDMSTYHALTTLRSRLFSILSRLGSTPRQIYNLQQNMRYGSDLTILEIKSRRRAWSSRDYVGGARLALVGLSTPVRSSPLARCEPVTAETLALAQAQAAQEPERARSLCLADEGAEFGLPGSCSGVRVMTKELDSRLFPLSEEDEEDEETSPTGYQSGYSFDGYVEEEQWRDNPEYDIESGLHAFPRPEPVGASASSPYSFPHSQSHPMVRPRTQSMRIENPTPLIPISESRSLSSSGGGLSPNSLLCQPLNVKVPVPVILDSGSELASGHEHGVEFTLAMDLPSPFSPPPRGWAGDNTTGARSRR
ncbi:hypothetical protein C8Q79DRAFT_902933 [Trametes meyenii]|nr:hypothetical protein C8Q79DRAFT_902933 [Trametes meyenii]